MAPKSRNPAHSRSPRAVLLSHAPQAWAMGYQGQEWRQLSSPRQACRRRRPSRSLPSFTPLTTSRSRSPTSATPTPPNSIKASITPGAVLIILSGRFKGKRVVFLKQLSSGFLLVTGPYKINGAPLRRVNQSYVIGTSAKVDISGVNLDKFDYKYFAKQMEKKKKKGESEFFEAEKQISVFFIIITS